MAKCWGRSGGQKTVLFLLQLPVQQTGRQALGHSRQGGGSGRGSQLGWGSGRALGKAVGGVKGGPGGQDWAPVKATLRATCACSPGPWGPGAELPRTAIWDVRTLVEPLLTGQAL